jgi:hypothetical protein
LGEIEDSGCHHFTARSLAAGDGLTTAEPALTRVGGFGTIKT